LAVVYFDSSALVKLVVDEPGTRLARRLWNGCDAGVGEPAGHRKVRSVLTSAASALALDLDDLIVAVWDLRLRSGVGAERLAVAPLVTER